MVDGMFPTPELIRSPCKNARDESPKIIGPPGFEKRTVAAIMMNDEQPHQESSGQYGQRQCNPPRQRQVEVNQIPKSDIRNERIDNLPRAAPRGRLLIFGHNLLPGRALVSALTCRQILLYHANVSGLAGGRHGVNTPWMVTHHKE